MSTPWRFVASSASAAIPARADRCTGSSPSSGQSRSGRAGSSGTGSYLRRSRWPRNHRYRTRQLAWLLVQPTSALNAAAAAVAARVELDATISAVADLACRFTTRTRLGREQDDDPRSRGRRRVRCLEREGEGFQRARYRDVRLGTKHPAGQTTAVGAVLTDPHLRQLSLTLIRFGECCPFPMLCSFQPRMCPACVRISPGKEDGCDLKPFIVTQRVRHPPGKGGARQPEASLAWAAATPLVKRRQRVLKPCREPRDHESVEAFAVLGAGGSTGTAVMVRPSGSTGVLEQGKGTEWVTWEPERSRRHPRGNRRKGSAGSARLQARSPAWRRPGALRRARKARTMRKPEAKT